MADRALMIAALAASFLVACGGQPAESSVAGRGSNDAAQPSTITVTQSRARQTTPTAPAKAAQSFGAFWTRFRTAALDDDAAGLATLSAPTVLRRGILDDDPGVSIEPDEVQPLVAALLKNDEAIDASGRSLRDTLAAGMPPGHDDAQPPGYRRVGPLVFEQRSSRWLLTELYVEE